MPQIIDIDQSCKSNKLKFSLFEVWNYKANHINLESFNLV